MKVVFPLALIGSMLCCEVNAGGLSPEQAVELAQSKMEAAGLEIGAVVAPSRQFPDCQTEIKVDLPKSDSNLIRMSCDQPNWQRSLRIDGALSKLSPALEVKVSHQSGDMNVMVFTRPMAKGDVIQSTDLVQAEVSARSLPDAAFLAPDLLIGRKLKQSVAAGRPVYARHLEPDYLVSAGQTVSIVSRSGFARISMVGRALENAQMGERVMVENLSSGRTIEARVVERDVVDVTLKSFGNEP